MAPLSLQLETKMVATFTCPICLTERVCPNVVADDNGADTVRRTFQSILDSSYFR